MKCSFCNSEDAVIHINEYSNEGIRKINLCINCAIKNGLNLSLNDINKIFLNLAKNIFNNKDIQKKLDSNRKDYKFSLVCPDCNTKIYDLSEDLRVGCPTCFNVFENIIDIIIFQKNNSLNYLGKLPLELKVYKNDRLKLSQLKNQLKKHIKHEEYDKAAIIRDKIKDLKKKIQKRIKKIANK